MRNLTKTDVEEIHTQASIEFGRRMRLWEEELKKQLLDSLFKDGFKFVAEDAPVPEVSVKEAMVMVAIATVIKNPETTRRHLFNVFRMSNE